MLGLDRDRHNRRPLAGRVRVPGDKSIAHRALILGALAEGRSRVRGLPTGQDVRSTRRALEALGVEFTEDEDGVVVHGGRLRSPAGPLDCGNSGTTLRLVLGALAGRPGLEAVLTGDASLRRRPMGRVVDPLRALGANISPRDRAPLRVVGAPLTNGPVSSPVASAQVKSALLLAGLVGEGRLTVDQPAPSRDHTERMLCAMGVTVEVDGAAVSLVGPRRLAPIEVDVPGDLSSAAFLLVAATIIPGSDVLLEDVGLNPTRTGVLDALARMGARIEVVRREDSGLEPRGDLRVRAAPLRGTWIGGAEIPRLIDELPVLAVAAAFAEGETVVTDAAELRVKESDRVASTVAMLRALGATAEARPDGFVVRGGGLCGGHVEARGDHRIALAAMVARRALPGETSIAGAEAAAVSFPELPAFLETLSG